MTAGSKAPENLVQMDFSAARLRIQPVLPVGNEKFQFFSTDLRSASSTPFTKRGDSCVPYFSASMMAS